MHSIKSNGKYWIEAYERLWKLMKSLIIIRNPMEVIRYSKEPFVRPKQFIWNGGTDTHTYIPLYLCAT